jgi:hypothetical protein
MAAEQIRSQTEIAKTRTQAEIDKYEADTRAAVDKYKADLDANVKVGIANANAQHTQALEDVKARNAAGLKHLENEGAGALEERRAALNPKMVEAKTKDNMFQQLQAMFQQMLQSQHQQTTQIMQAITALGGPKRVVRDKSGRIEGVTPG